MKVIKHADADTLILKRMRPQCKLSYVDKHFNENKCALVASSHFTMLLSILKAKIFSSAKQTAGALRPKVNLLYTWQKHFFVFWIMDLRCPSFINLAGGSRCS
ncbi:hypothetical protein ILYODFUR_025734 [Ilyodon furcidens]|uniref:Uncharacterized protein n=1 Tax=Ilyodon furcidens TaxID=33524 RepID=A0ABV0VHL0_9TELE